MAFGDIGSIFGVNQAVMGIIIYVVDVESGEVIASENITESVSTSNVAVEVAYKGIGFGGCVLSHSSGRATSRVIDRAVKRITAAIAAQPWEPRVALVQADGSVLINGGRDRGVKFGAEFEVWRKARRSSTRPAATSSAIPRARGSAASSSPRSTTGTPWRRWSRVSPPTSVRGRTAAGRGEAPPHCQVGARHALPLHDPPTGG